MAVTPYDFVLDISKKKLLESIGSLSTLDAPRFYRGDTAAFTLRMVRPAGDFANPTPITPFPAGSSLTVAIGTPGANADVLTGVPADVVESESRSGSLLIDTIDLRTYLGDAGSMSAWLEFRLTELDGTKTVLAQVACTIFNVVTIDTATPEQVETAAGIAIAACEAAAANANAAAIAANEAALGARSAYQVAVDNGFVGTEAEWLASLEGATGPQGRSAYQVAVDNGFVGTESEWLASLEGPIGPTGPTGPTGALAGSAGVVIISSAGTYTLTDADRNGHLIEVSASAGTVNLSLSDAPPAGFACEVIKTSTAVVHFQLAGGSTRTLLQADGLSNVRTAGSIASVRATSTKWIVAGDLD